MTLNILKTCIISLLAMLLLPTLYGNGKGEVKISAGVTPKETTVGSSVEYRVSIAGKELSKIEILLPEEREFFPDPKKEDTKKKKKKPGDEEETENEAAAFVPLYEIHSARKEDSSEKDISYLTVVMRLSYYRPGTYSLPPIEIKSADKKSITYAIPTVTLKPLNEKGQLQQIEPPLDLGGNYTRLIIIIVMTVLLTLAGFFIYRYIKKRREAAAAEEIVIPPIETFRSEMEKLQGEKLIETEKTEEYVFGVSTVFRRFLSGLLEFDAMEMTTEEVNRILKKTGRRLGVEVFHDEIMTAFNLWDLSKFAEFTPSKEILLENLKKTGELAEKMNRKMDHGTA